MILGKERERNGALKGKQRVVWMERKQAFEKEIKDRES